QGLLKSVEFDVPVISVGNITVGGTGKTPHVEYLISILKDDFRVAVLSRGYKRKSKGFILAGDNSGSLELGDEPAQIKSKFPEIIVAVSSNRVYGIRSILKTHPGIDVIILDDAFQHRSVTPGINILLTDFNRLMTRDYLLPMGRLREHKYNRRRADYIIVTKSPSQISPLDRRLIVNEIPPASHQYLYFTTINYLEPKNIFNPEAVRLTMDNILNEGYHVLLVTGIAFARPVKEHLNKFSSHIKHLSYNDHHWFGEKDLDLFEEVYNSMPRENRCIITTEKDAARLKEITNIAQRFDNNVFYLPIVISFLNDDTDAFNHFIVDYVRKNKPNRILSQEEGDR
ncbi:MAG: tetraacyldisaccharide 4'-kinase, partial [Bacteroidales bacterium]|nr:tetraacyldisaccharide 4'-kinase [Bacteroidales bacterium]